MLPINFNGRVWDIPAVPNRRVQRQGLSEADIQSLSASHRRAALSGPGAERQVQALEVGKAVVQSRAGFRDYLRATSLIMLPAVRLLAANSLRPLSGDFRG